jgi:hypothetical protein
VISLLFDSFFFVKIVLLTCQEKHMKFYSKSFHTCIRCVLWGSFFSVVVLLCFGQDFSNFLHSINKHKNGFSLVSQAQNPVVFSRDNQNRPFSITADTAKQTGEKDTLKVLLIQPVAKIEDMQGEQTMWHAQKGVYSPQKKIMKLKGKVSIETKSGYYIQTNSATLFVNRKIIQGNHNVQGYGPLGNISGQGFMLIQSASSNTLTLKGKSYVQFFS